MRHGHSPVSTVRLAVVLGLLASVGPFAIDMYLPALPSVATELDAPISAVQATLIAYFIAFGVSQLAWGPISDRIGRKTPLILGLGIFILGSASCAIAPSIGWLIAARFVQGIGGSVLMVVPRAVIRDTATGTDAARIMALVMLVISVSPMLAPLAGSGVIALGGWRLVFLALLAAAVASLVVTQFFLPETLPPASRVRVSPSGLARGSAVLLSDRWFVGLTLVGGFGFASFVVFIASASFVYTQSFGLTPTEFSLAFAANAAGFFAASQVAATLGQRFGMDRVVLAGTTGFALFSSLLFGLAWAGLAPLAVVIGLLVVANAFLGVVIPSTMVMALDPHGAIAGLASSLGGALQMILGGLVVVVSGPFFDGTTVPMVAAIAACGGTSAALAWAVLFRPACAADV
ncbi:multidrug effflux MFS transporter [Salinarimonas rosea]|uniref:multidrug effflux MFS transporter n=1 Tax=Salinarimonas rosea TaxID=552063 RepID=UPI00040CFEDD|nr:multidrug effflux MFS transporter [Salinarimonas rosea]